jgi:hypothetical protein
MEDMVFCDYQVEMVLPGQLPAPADGVRGVCGAFFRAHRSVGLVDCAMNVLLQSVFRRGHRSCTVTARQIYR